MKYIVQTKKGLFSLFLASLCVVLGAVSQPAHAIMLPLSGDALQVQARTDLRGFTDWLNTNNQKGYLGEFGWPNNVSSTDQERWNILAESYYKDLDANGLWATPWATGSNWGNYPLSIYNKVDPLSPGSVSVAMGQAEVVERHLSASDYRRGINVAGGSFAQGTGATSTYSNANPGTYGTDYFYDDQATFNYLKSRGVDVVRIDFTWERIQPTLNGALDTAELQRLTDVVNRAGTAGLKVILDMHNFGAYYLTDGSQGVRTTIGEGAVTQAAFNNVWTRLSTAFGGNANVVAYGLMNEPHDIASTFSSQLTHYNFDANNGPWSTDSGSLSHNTTTAHSGAGSMQLALNFNTDNTAFLGDNQGSLHDYSANGPTLATYVYLPPGTTGAYFAAISTQNAAFSYVQGPNVNLVPGQWTRVEFTPTSGQLAATRALALTIGATGAANTTTNVLVDDFQQGTSVSGVQTWEQASQQALSAIRTNSDNKLVMVAGYNYSSVKDWPTIHASNWITDPSNNFRYEAHQYFDCDGSGQYIDSYSQSLTCAQGDGFSAVGPGAPTGNIALGDTLANNQVRLTLSDQDDVDQQSTTMMRLSSVANFSGASWQNFSATPAWNYSPGVSQTVYVQYRDSAGNLSAIYPLNFVGPTVLLAAPNAPNTGLAKQSFSMALAGRVVFVASLVVGAAVIIFLKQRTRRELKLGAK
jgi:hypothetical protein